MSVLLAVSLGILAAAVVAITLLGGGAPRTARTYHLRIDGRARRSRIVFASRFVRAMIRVGLFPARRSGFTPTGHGLLRDSLGVATLDTILHEMRHQVQRFRMPCPRWMPRLLKWPFYYFANQAELEADAKEWAAQQARGWLDPTVTIPPNVFEDGK